MMNRGNAPLPQPRRRSPLEELLLAEVQARRSLSDTEAFGVEKIRFLASAALQSSRDPTDVRVNSMMKIKVAAQQQAAEQRQQRAIARAKSNVEHIRALARKHKEAAAAQHAAAVAARDRSSQRRPSQYEVLMANARAYQRLSALKSDVVSRESDMRGELQVEQLDARKEIMRSQVRELLELELHLRRKMRMWEREGEPETSVPPCTSPIHAHAREDTVRDEADFVIDE